MIGYAVFCITKGKAELSEEDAYAEVFADRDEAEKRREDLENDQHGREGIEVVVRDAVLSLF